MRKEPFLSQGADSDSTEIKLGVLKNDSLPINRSLGQVKHRVTLSGITLFFAAAASIGICTIAFVAVYRTFVLPI